MMIAQAIKSAHVDKSPMEDSMAGFIMPDKDDLHGDNTRRDRRMLAETPMEESMADFIMADEYNIHGNYSRLDQRMLDGNPMEDSIADSIVADEDNLHDNDSRLDRRMQAETPMEDSMAAFIAADGDSIHEDDPHLDWRTQVNGPIDHTSDEEDNSSVVSDPPTVGDFLHLDHRKPRELVETETLRSTQPLGAPGTQRVHKGYSNLLSSICSFTGTEEACPHVSKGLPYAVSKAQSLTLDRMYDSIDNLANYASSLVVYLWLVVCLRLQYDQSPENTSVSSRMAAYFLAAHTVVTTVHKVTWQELKFATQYWEERMANQGQGDIWLKDDAWYQDIPGLQGQPRPNDQVAEEYMSILETEGKAELAKAIMAKEKDGPKTSLRDAVGDPKSRLNHEREILIMLVSMDIHLLKAIIQGQVSRKAETPGDPVWTSLEVINDPKVVQPSIYMNSICDCMGISPTPEQWDEICDYMYMYVDKGDKHNKFAAEIDQLIYPTDKWPLQKAERGLRRYTDWKPSSKNGNSSPCLERRQMVRHFISEMKGRIQVERAKGRCHVPFAAPVIEIGFSINSHHRLWEHRHHQNSNYLMNLAEAVLQYVFPEMFRLQQRIIFGCFRPLQDWHGEVVLTQLAQGYTKGARGFSHYAAGFSNNSAWMKGPKERWAMFQLQTLQRTLILKELDGLAEHAMEKRKQAREEQEKAERVLESKIEGLQAFVDMVDALSLSTNAEIELMKENLEKKR